MRIVFLLFVVCFPFLGTSSAQDSTKVKRVKFYPLPAFGYSPETRWYVGAVALFNIRFSRDTVYKPSSVKTEFNITQNKQWVATTNFDLRLNKERFIVTGANGYYKFPEDYWGIGVQSQEKDKVNYNARRVELDNSFLTRMLPDLYVGLRYRYHNMLVEDYNPDLNMATNQEVRYETGGLGITAIYDSRDNLFNPQKGCYIATSALFFDNFFGGTYQYRQYSADIRAYYPVYNGGVLAAQVVSSMNEGTAPFRMLPSIGNENTMRGYYNGRYRDDKLMAAQIEFRTVIWKWIGGTAFAGGATLFNKTTESFGETVLPNYGIGLRIRVDKKDNINLRFDYGIGKNSDGFYVAFAEAF